MSMKKVKKKWAEASPVFASIFFIIAIIYLFIWGMLQFATWLSAPDLRTVEEIKTERYKDCIKYTRWSFDEIKGCEVYLELKSK